MLQQEGNDGSCLGSFIFEIIYDRNTVKLLKKVNFMAKAIEQISAVNEPRICFLSVLVI